LGKAAGTRSESSLLPLQYVYLIVAIAAETIGTSALQASAQFSRLWPSLLVVFSYGTAFYFMALALKFMPVGIVYAIWSGLGIVLIALIGFVIFGQKLDLAAVLGLILIIFGILIIHLFSNSAAH
jgi:small multidrug resistance pump